MIIHRYWTGPRALPFPAWGPMIAAANPNHELVDHTDDTLPTYIRELADRVTDWVPAQWAARHRANIVRLELLISYGGWWLDHDVMPLVALDELPFPATAVHDTGSRCNCFLAFPARDASLIAVRDHALGYLSDPTRPHSRVGEVSGEVLVDQFCAESVGRIPMMLTSYGTLRPEAPQLLHMFNHRKQPARS